MKEPDQICTDQQGIFDSCLLLRHCFHWCTSVIFSAFVYTYSTKSLSDVADIYELRHEISNIAVCATSKASDQTARMGSLIRAFASRLNIL